LGDVTGKSMFGGFGFWESGDMFALLSSQGVFHFKTDDTTVARYRKAKAVQFAPEMSRGVMPTAYWSVPKAVLHNDERFLEWGAEAVVVGHATAAPKKKRSTRKRPPSR